MAWIVLVVIVLLGVFLIAMYNGLVQLRVRSDSAWSDIDVQLKRRHDLIPGLAAVCAGLASHERETQPALAAMRAPRSSRRSPVNRTRLPR